MCISKSRPIANNSTFSKTNETSMGSQEEDPASVTPKLAMGGEYHVVGHEEDALQDSNSLDIEVSNEDDVPGSLNTIETRQDRSQKD